MSSLPIDFGGAFVTKAVVVKDFFVSVSELVDHTGYFNIKTAILRYFEHFSLLEPFNF